MKKSDLYSVFTGVFVACLLISNILAAKTFTFGSAALPTSIILYPVIYILNDVLVEIYGYRKMRRIIFLGFAMNLLAIVAYSVAILLPSPELSQEAGEAFRMILGDEPRILLACFASYLAGSLLNAKVMEKLKKRYEKQLFLRCITSTFLGESVDSTIFITIVFIGTMPAATLVVTIVCQAMLKVGFEFVLYPATKKVISILKSIA